MNLNKEYIIRFTTKKSQYFGRYFRKIVKSEHLPRYIGDKNALNALQSIKMFKGDKIYLSLS